MVYYAITKENLENMEYLNIHQEEIYEITRELNEKYPIYHSCTSFAKREANKVEYNIQSYKYRREFAIRTNELYEQRKAFGQEVLNDVAVPMMGRTKAVLVRECAVWMKKNGIKEAFVRNWIFSSEYHDWEVTQSWYVFEENGQYFFKMRQGCKAKHLIEGVVE